MRGRHGEGAPWRGPTWSADARRLRTLLPRRGSQRGGTSRRRTSSPARPCSIASRRCCTGSGRGGSAPNGAERDADRSRTTILRWRWFCSRSRRSVLRSRWFCSRSRTLFLRSRWFCSRSRTLFLRSRWFCSRSRTLFLRSRWFCNRSRTLFLRSRWSGDRSRTSAEDSFVVSGSSRRSKQPRPTVRAGPGNPRLRARRGTGRRPAPPTRYRRRPFLPLRLPVTVFSLRPARSSLRCCTCFGSFFGATFRCCFRPSPP